MSEKAKEKSDAVVPTAQRPKGQPSVAEAFQHLKPLSRSSEMEEPNELCLLLHRKWHDAIQHCQQRRLSEDAVHFWATVYLAYYYYRDIIFYLDKLDLTYRDIAFSIIAQA